VVKVLVTYGVPSEYQPLVAAIFDVTVGMKVGMVGLLESVIEKYGGPLGHKADGSPESQVLLRSSSWPGEITRTPSRPRWGEDWTDGSKIACPLSLPV
jgi:hypothetical protein